jgi:dimethylamine/trimethylamine dehydrogenase
MGEEWRRGWHPERIPPKKTSEEILIVGGGPAGLECAHTLGMRGYQVTVVEARREFGGRVVLESALPGLIEWRRVIDWRLDQIKKMGNVSLYPGSPMDAEDILETGYSHVIIATGAEWRDDGVGRSQWKPIQGHGLPIVFTPDDLMAGKIPDGHVLVYDDDHYYMGGVLAELLLQRGCQVTLVTPAPLVSYWAQFTLEQKHIQRRLSKSGAKMFTQKSITEIFPGKVVLESSISSQQSDLSVDAVVLVTDRLSIDDLYQHLKPSFKQGKIDSLRVIGDAEAANIIAQAVFSGHLAAREFGEGPSDSTPFRVERVER